MPVENKSISESFSPGFTGFINREQEIKKKLFLVSIFRIILQIVLIVSTLLLTLDSGFAIIPQLRNYLLVVGFANLIPAIAYLPVIRYTRSYRSLIFLHYLQTLQDTIFAATLVIVTGGTASAFTFFFSLKIIVSSIIVSRIGAIFTAALSSLFVIFIGLMEIELFDTPTFFENILVTQQEITVFYNGIINIIAFFSIAFLASYLSEQIRQKDILRENLRMTLEDLKILNEHILSSLSSAIISISPNNKIIFMNRGAEEILERHIVGIKGFDIGTVIPEIVPYLAENRIDFEIRHRPRGEKNFKFLSCTISPLKNRAGENIGKILLMSDITHVKEIEQKLKKGEQLATIGKLASIVAHEIRNPLASISGSIQLINQGERLSNEDRQLIKIVMKEVDNLNRWISDLLDYAKPKRGEKKRVNLLVLVRESMSLMSFDQHTEKIKFDMKSSGDFFINAEEGRLKQVFINIFKNAIEAMPNGGMLGVNISEVLYQREIPAILVAISDTGRGMEDEVKERIFEAFFTTKERGTGLGLAIALQIVQDHNGWIEVESEPGKGSSFNIYFLKESQ